jgi:hypothetical protein
VTVCTYDGRCSNETPIDFPFCVDHLSTPRGRQVVFNVIGSGNMTLASDVENAINNAQIVPDADYQTTALEKMVEALERILMWEAESRKQLDLIPKDQWRFTDRTGSEQTRAEVGIYERALDKTSRILSSMSRAALNEKIITLGRAQVELMVRIMMSLISELELDNQTTDRARILLLEMLKREANLTPAVENIAAKSLESDKGSGGVRIVSIQGERVYGA